VADSPIKALLRANPKLRRRVSGKRMPIMLYPAAAERRYVRALQGWVDGMAAEVLPDLEPLIAAGVAAQSRTDAARADVADWQAGIRRLLKAKAAAMMIPQTAIDEAAEQTDDFNEAQIRAVTRKLFGISLEAADTGIKKAAAAFSRENVELITTLKKNTFKRIRQEAERGVLAGRPNAQIAKDLREAFGIERRHARLIARDQVSKLNGQLTETRQTALGIESYTWQTSGDDRVRATHRSKNGNVYKWSDPPSDTGHPGQDFQCRCTARAVIPLFADL
jgi:SPP1 gp7 family putative phage head morphogenesis protein